MGIRCLCPNGHRLHVKSDLAGRRGVCPDCGVKFPIPLASTLGAKDRTAPAEMPQPFAKATHELDAEAEVAEQDVAIESDELSLDALLAGGKHLTWKVKHPSGGEYGPADAETFRLWFREGRIPPDALLRRSDWDRWQRMGDCSPAPVVDVVIDPHAPLPATGLYLPAVRKRKRTWLAIALLSLASLIMLIGLIIVLASSS